MQGQLESCDLEECDFLQVKFMEYFSENDYIEDFYLENGIVKEGYSSNKLPKGLLIVVCAPILFWGKIVDKITTVINNKCFIIYICK